MYIIKLYNDDDVLVDIIGDFEEYKEAEKWIQDYAKDDEYGIIKDIGEKK